ncbi:MAG: hypothetical protein ABW076_16360 [Candidatus Thiodiazotropha sp.]
MGRAFGSFTANCGQQVVTVFLAQANGLELYLRPAVYHSLKVRDFTALILPGWMKILPSRLLIG